MLASKGKRFAKYVGKDGVVREKKGGFGSSPINTLNAKLREEYEKARVKA
jgi:hypothetical protein